MEECFATGKQPLYTVRLGESHTVAEHVSYEVLLRCILERTLRAAVARSRDVHLWEDDELRRRGLDALQIERDDRALWPCAQTFEAELDAARQRHREPEFLKRNELDLELFERLDRDLRNRLRRAGYEVPSLRREMKCLFKELESDAADRSSEAADGLVTEVLHETFPGYAEPG